MTLDPRVAIAMSARKLLAIAVASLVLLGGAAAVGAASPADQANGNATVATDETPAENETDDIGGPDGEEVPTDRPEAEMPADRPGMNNPSMGPHDANASAAGSGVGPADGLPSQVPDHVSAIHDTIGSFLDGSIENLGEALGDLLGGDAEVPAEDSPAAGEA